MCMSLATIGKYVNCFFFLSLSNFVSLALLFLVSLHIADEIEYEWFFFFYKSFFCHFQYMYAACLLAMVVVMVVVFLLLLQKRMEWNIRLSM